MYVLRVVWHIPIDSWKANNCRNSVQRLLVNWWLHFSLEVSSCVCSSTWVGEGWRCGQHRSSMGPERGNWFVWIWDVSVWMRLRTARWRNTRGVCGFERGSVLGKQGCLSASRWWRMRSLTLLTVYFGYFLILVDSHLRSDSQVSDFATKEISCVIFFLIRHFLKQ